MPIYEYRCDSCSSKFERLSSFAERDVAQACPACDSARTHVLVSSFAALGAETVDVTASGAGGCCGGGCGCGCSVN